MAIRIHVTAVRDCTPEQVRSCFTEILGPTFAEVPLHQKNGWISFHTSVWGVGANDLVKGLTQLGKPGLQFTTSDGDRWYLSVFGGGQAPVQFLHEFGPLSYEPNPEQDDEYTEPEPEESFAVDPELAFLEDDPVVAEKPNRPWSPFD
jgi:hypothetical protein